MDKSKTNKDELKPTKLDAALENGYKGMLAATPYFAGAAVATANVLETLPPEISGLSLPLLLLGWGTSMYVEGEIKDNIEYDSHHETRNRSHNIGYMSTHFLASSLWLSAIISTHGDKAPEADNTGNEITVEQSSAQAAPKADAKTFVWQPS